MKTETKSNTACPAPKDGAELSPTMFACLTTAIGNGNALHRHPGGFWMNKQGTGLSYGTKSVQALVDRGLAVYSEWKDGRNGRFPIAINLT